MKKYKLIQGTREWELAKETRIGSSEVFDIVRYYATEQELLNCGLNPEEVMNEKPFYTAWALYHKILRDGLYQKAELDPAYTEYGHAMEKYGRMLLQQGRANKLKAGSVYADNRCIASLDIEGITEDIDRKPFDFGNGFVPVGKPFVCEQKTLFEYKNNLPVKYIIQAQFQVTETKKDLFILQVMILKNDTEFERGKITMLAEKSPVKLAKYLQGKVMVNHYYFQNNEALAVLIKLCLSRFFAYVDARKEPRAFIENDSQKNIILSLRANSFYNDKMVLEYPLLKYAELKLKAELAEQERKDELQKIIDCARDKNASRFICDGFNAMFAANGNFLCRTAKGGAE
jgi:hypothetical protein